MNKKKVALAIVVILIAVVLVVFIATKVMKKDGNSSENTAKDIGEATVVDNYNIEIKSSKKNKIEKDGIVAEKIKLQILGDQLQVLTTLKNESGEKLNGYLIEMDLVDESGKSLTTIAKNSNDVVEAGATIELENYVMGLDNPQDIEGAKIKTLEKMSAQQSLEQTFEDMTPDEVQDQEGDSSTQTVTPNVVGPQQDEAE